MRARAFTYFDLMKPSPLTVFGWGLFIPGILTIAQLLHEKLPLESFIRDIPRIAPVVSSIVLLIVCACARAAGMSCLSSKRALIFRRRIAA